VKSSFLVSQDFDKGAKKFLEHPHTQNFIQDSIFKGHDVNLILKSVHSSWTIHLGKKVFLEQFDLEEKTAAESILNHPRNRKMIWELAFNGSGFSEAQITSSLNEKFKNQVLKLTIRNQIEQRFKSEDLDFVKILFKPGSKYENSYNMVLNSCKKSRAVMRLMLLSTLSEAVRNKSKPSLEIQMKLEILKTITQNTPQVDFLDLIFTSQQKAQCSLHELKKLKQDIYVIKAQKALETNSVDPLLDIPEEELFKLPKDLLGKLEHARLIEEYLEL
jgi:hypothetical protein